MAGPASPRRSFFAWLRSGYDGFLLWRDRLPFVWRAFLLATLTVAAIFAWWELEPAPPPPGIVTTEARVVDIQSETRRDEAGFLRRRYALFLEFEAADGQTQRFQTGFSAAHHETRIGDRVLVEYEAGDPGRVNLAAPEPPYLLLRAALAGAWCLLALFLIWPLFTGRGL